MRPLRNARAAFALAAFAALAFAQSDPWGGEPKAGPAAIVSAKQKEEAWFVPGGPGANGSPTLLKARVFRPAGDGPYKVAIVSHGSPASAAARPGMAVPRFSSATAWLLERGYLVVLPLRRGYGDSTPWMEDYGSCNGADYVRAGLASADDILATARYFAGLTITRPDRILLVGLSAGGWGTVAAASRNPEGVFAAINFSGGRGGHQGRYGDENCSPGNLVRAAATFGSTAKVPSLWLYANNDTFFDGALSRKMFEAYQGAGGNAQYVLFPDFKKDGHGIFGDADGKALWNEPASGFLGKLE